MQDSLTELFRYNDQMNKKLIVEAEKNAAKLSEKSESLFSHILAAHYTWTKRIINETIEYSPWHHFALAKWHEENDTNHSLTAEILNDFKAADKIAYKTSEGINYTNTLSDILFHIINHSTYHRAQIASDFKESGITPIVSDFIAFKRS